MDNEAFLNEFRKMTKAMEDRMDARMITRELEHMRVADRHEALAQTVEIMAFEGIRLQRTVAELARITTGLVEISRRSEKRLEKLEGGQ